MALIQYVSLTGTMLGRPVDASSYVRPPNVGDLVSVRSKPIGVAERMQVVGIEHRSVNQGGAVIPALAVFVAPYVAAEKSLVPEVGADTGLELPDGH